MPCGYSRRTSTSYQQSGYRPIPVPYRILWLLIRYASTFLHEHKTLFTSSVSKPRKDKTVLASHPRPRQLREMMTINDRMGWDGMGWLALAHT